MAHRWLAVAVILCGIGGMFGCDQLASNQDNKKQAAPEIRVADRKRFEIHEIRNGGFQGTVLLDTFTGKCWIFGHDTKDGKITGTMFSALAVYPEPIITDPNDPLGIRGK